MKQHCQVLTGKSRATIYAFIFRAAQKAETLWRYLVGRKATRGRRARRSKDRITDKTHISQRSRAANALTALPRTARQTPIKARDTANGWPLPEPKGSTGSLPCRSRQPTVVNNPG
jgi:hypothetical protein